MDSALLNDLVETRLHDGGARVFRLDPLILGAPHITELLRKYLEVESFEITKARVEKPPPDSNADERRAPINASAIFLISGYADLLRITDAPVQLYLGTHGGRVELQLFIMPPRDWLFPQGFRHLVGTLFELINF